MTREKQDYNNYKHFFIILLVVVVSMYVYIYVFGSLLLFSQHLKENVNKS